MLDLRLLKAHVEKRDYQLQAAQNVIMHNTLVVMPTALGKTFVAALVAAHYLSVAPTKKILFLAPTKPLVDQQAGRMREVLDVPADNVVAVTGDVSPDERQALYQSAQIIAGTPQTVEHDVLARKLVLSDFSLVIFDEAHRAVGEYAYVFLGEMARATTARILGLTASPSSQKEKVQLICDNLGIKHLELRRESDPSVSQYSAPVKMDFVFVDLPSEFKVLQTLLNQMLSETLGQLKEGGFADSADPHKTTNRAMLAMRGKITAAIAQKNPAGYAAASLNARAMNLSHGLDLLESQGVDALHAFLLGLKERKTQSKAVAGLVSDFRITKLIIQSDELLSQGIVHPKIARLKAIVDEQVSRGKTLIVFAHFRDTAQRLSEELCRLPGVTARMLVGRAGMSQKKQKALLDQFRDKEFNVLVCTSVGEEGLDIEAVDTVIFYEAVPSEIRSIQRRGRAGRVRAGNAIVLLAKNTKDEAFFWISRRKERQMHDTLDSMSRDMSRIRHAQNAADKAVASGGDDADSGSNAPSNPASETDSTKKTVGGQKGLGEF
ncbi:DEAD/DEAH box helicase [Candidatus Micrarchaeota archaeon]|nr:DEAD/DEAH box helicase [Candidatus Micrarchaeota archaeon]